MEYHPESVSDWERGDHYMYGIHPPLLEDVVSFAHTNDSKMDRNIGKALAGGHFSEPLP